MVKMMEYRTRKDKEEGKLKTEAQFVTDISTAGTLMDTICKTDIGTPAAVVRKSSYTAMKLKEARRNINRMKGQKQGT